MFRVLTGITVLAMVISGCGAESGSSPADARSVGGGADLQALGVTEADEICAKAYSTLKNRLPQEQQEALALDGGPAGGDVAIRQGDRIFSLLASGNPEVLQGLQITPYEAMQCRWSIGQLTLQDIAFSLLDRYAQTGYASPTYSPTYSRRESGGYSTLPQGSGGSQSQGSENQPRCWNCWQ